MHEAVTIELGTRFENRVSGLTEIKDSFQYIPLLQGLRALLRNQEILDEVRMCMYVRMSLVYVLTCICYLDLTSSCSNR